MFAVAGRDRRRALCEPGSRPAGNVFVANPLGFEKRFPLAGRGLLHCRRATVSPSALSQRITRFGLGGWRSPYGRTRRVKQGAKDCSMISSVGGRNLSP